jgi:uncharacterized protein with von Willebrand factor type A (vWA) domain
VSAFPHLPACGPADSPVVRRTLGFLRLLRGNGFPVGIEEAVDAGRLARDSGFADRNGFRLAMRALLCSSRLDWRRFDELFDLHWHDRGRKHAVRSNRPDQRTAPAIASPAAGPPAGPASEVQRGIDGDGPPGGGAQRGASASEVLAATDLRHINDADAMRRVEDLTERLAARMRYRITRRHRLRRKGRKLDLRRTIHRSIQFGGEPLNPVFRRRRAKPVRLVLILDASGSMNLYSSFFVRFVRGIIGSFRESEAFVFHTRLAHISPALRERDLDRALERMAILASGWSGGTRIGESLRRFNDEYAAKIINSRTIVVIMSDGYDTGEPGELGEQMRRLKRRARRIVWLNPLIGWDGYQPVARGMAAALPHIDLFAPAHNLESLMALEQALTRL